MTKKELVGWAMIAPLLIAAAGLVIVNLWLYPLPVLAAIAAGIWFTCAVELLRG